MPPIENNTIDLNKFTKHVVGLGSNEQAITNALYGLNPTYEEQALPMDTNHKMHIFFTRPQLNLTEANCILSNELIKLLTDNKNSIHRYTRLALDPRLYHTPANIKSDLLDPFNPFIPIFSNLCTKISGWPDVVMASKASAEGNLKEQTVVADGTVDIYNEFQLDMTFRNIASEPITTIVGAWMEYMDKVHKGNLMPYTDMIVRREIDYMTRVYVIVVDEQENVIKKIANIGAGFPITNPMGMFFDYDKNSQHVNASKDINVSFKCIGAEYNKHNSMLDFNTLVAAFHPKMKKMHTGSTSSGMVQVHEDVITIFKNRVYPYIDLATNRLLWYTDEENIKFIDKEGN